jgi:hypothetical protein
MFGKEEADSDTKFDLHEKRGKARGAIYIVPERGATIRASTMPRKISP